ncbi:Cacna1c, partial [Symbiodinium sp. CCMP2456]
VSVALPKLKGKRTAPQAVKTEETEVVRVILAKDFAEGKAWKEALKGFCGFVMARLAVTDAWGAAEERRLGPVIVGLARVKKSLVASVLGRSGQDGLFVEPTGRTASYGVAWVETEAGEPVEVRAWRVPAVPRHCDAEVVKEVLEEAGFAQVTITSRMVRKGTATWFVRAAGKEDLATISVNEGKDTVEIYVLSCGRCRWAGAEEFAGFWDVDLTLALWYHADHYDLLLPEDKAKEYRQRRKQESQLSACQFSRGSQPSVHTLRDAFRAASLRAFTAGDHDLEAAGTGLDAGASAADRDQLEQGRAGTIAIQELDIDDLLEEETAAMPPPPPAATRSNGHVRSKRGKSTGARGRAQSAAGLLQGHA